MKRKPVNQIMNATSERIINTIRSNGSLAFQSAVPEINKNTYLPGVGDVLQGNPGIANEFISALMNQIAVINCNTANFYNKFAELKKGKISLGEVIEEVFINLCKVREFSPEKATQRELARTIADVRSAFHVMNVRLQYPLTIQYQDIARAFLSENGVSDFVSKMTNSVYMASEYDDYLLFKYMLIKAYNASAPSVTVSDTSEDMTTCILENSDNFEFVKTKYNIEGVHNACPKNEQYLIIPSHEKAKMNVEVLATAFNMDKVEFMGHVITIDDFTTFDNERFETIRENSTMIDEVTEAELTKMENVKCILVSSEFFQYYDNSTNMRATEIASGDYYNYFYNVYKTVSFSPFSNILYITKESVTAPATVNMKVSSVLKNTDGSAIVTLETDTLNFNLIQDEATAKKGIAIIPSASIYFPATGSISGAGTSCTPKGKFDGFEDTYTGTAIDLSTIKVGNAITFTKA